MCSKSIFLLSVLNFLPIVASAQIDTVSIKNRNLQTQYILPGNSVYLNFTKDSKSGVFSNFSISKRGIYINKFSGRNAIIVVQDKLNSDTSKFKRVYTICDQQTFQTLFDKTSSAAGVEAYNYDVGEITAADTVPNNSIRGFHLKFNDLPFCLELDLETVSALPIKKIGQKMAILFYQPGRADLPKYHLMEVAREEFLPTVKGAFADCWVIKLFIDSDDYDLFWVSKSKREFLKLESHGATDIFCKVKLFNENLQF